MRILLVDDDLIALRHCSLMLQSSPRVEIIATQEPEAAVTIIQEGSLDAIVTDHVMSPLTGVDLLEIAHREQPEALRVLITAHADLSLARDALTRGRVHRLFQKPVDGPKLRQALGVGPAEDVSG